jgi:hypothetical protein
MRDRELGAFGDDVQIAVGDQRRDLEDRVGVRIEPGHLQVDPDQVVVVRPWLMRKSSNRGAD